jgi:hypothetical protein
MSMKADLVPLSEVAHEMGVPAKTISNLFYQGKLGERHALVIAGRRLIYKNRIGEVREAVASMRRRRPAAKV